MDVSFPSSLSKNDDSKIEKEEKSSFPTLNCPICLETLDKNIFSAHQQADPCIFASREEFFKAIEESTDRAVFHVFDEECITRWLREKKENSCPECRQEMNLTESLEMITRISQLNARESFENHIAVLRQASDQLQNVPRNRIVRLIMRIIDWFFVI